jgi:hypothetical protein
MPRAGSGGGGRYGCGDGVEQTLAYLLVSFIYWSGDDGHDGDKGGCGGNRGGSFGGSSSGDGGGGNCVVKNLFSKALCLPGCVCVVTFQSKRLTSNAKPRPEPKSMGSYTYLIEHTLTLLSHTSWLLRSINIRPSSFTYNS